MSSDPPAAVAALHNAIELHPEGDDYVRLARLESEPARQVQWLERAATLDPANAYTQAELGYAYLHAGSPASSLAAFERAGSLDPDNMNVQIELGYGSWRAGRFDERAKSVGACVACRSRQSDAGAATRLRPSAAEAQRRGSPLRRTGPRCIGGADPALARQQCRKRPTGVSVFSACTRIWTAE